MHIDKRVAQGAILLATWWLVQVPAKDVRLGNPGSNLPPVTEFKRVREFKSAGECEAFRDVAMQDASMEGSEAMLDQSSSLRCVSADQLAGPTAGPATPGPAVP